MREGLVRKAIIDSLGRKTTRWVRPEATGPRPALPGPQLPAQAAQGQPGPRSRFLAQLIELENNWTYLPIVDPEMLARLDQVLLDAAARPSEEGENLRHVLHSLTEMAFKDLRAGKDPAAVHNVALFAGQVVPDGAWFRADDLLNAIDGLTQGPPLTPECFRRFRGIRDFSCLDAEALEQARALVLAAATLAQAFVTAVNSTRADGLLECRFVAEEGLAALIMDRPGEAERIVAAANEHMTADAGRIRAILDHPVEVLSDGVL